MNENMTPLPQTTDELPWGLKAYNAIQAARYFLEEDGVPLSENERKIRAIELLRAIEAPTPDDFGVKP